MLRGHGGTRILPKSRGARRLFPPYVAATLWPPPSPFLRPSLPPASGGEEARSSPRLQHTLQPVPHVVDADRHVVDLAVVEAAFLAVEHLEGLLLGADCVEAFLRQRQRDLLVAAAMHEQERALHLLHDAVEPEALELLQRG